MSHIENIVNILTDSLISKMNTDDNIIGYLPNSFQVWEDPTGLRDNKYAWYSWLDVVVVHDENYGKLSQIAVGVDIHRSKIPKEEADSILELVVDSFKSKSNFIAKSIVEDWRNDD